MEIKTKRNLSFLLFLISFTFCPFYKSFAEKIQSFNSNIEIKKDATVYVEETINFDTEGLQKHGIIRSLNFKRTNQEGKTYITDIEILGVTDSNGNPYNFSKSKIGNYIELKIGDADKFIKGVKTYIIKYKISGALTYFSDHDELYWNLTGNSWNFPIERYSALITLPENVVREETKYVCYTGPVGSTTQLCEIDISDNVINISSNKPLNPGDGITVGVSFSKGAVEIIEPREDKPNIIFIILWGILGLLASLWYVFLPIKVLIDSVKKENFTKKNERIVSAWFEPPRYDNDEIFSPSETGFIVDGKIDHKELTATIIHLAQRGFLKIREDEKKDFTFIKLKNTKSSELRNFENEVMEAIFEKGDEVTARELRKSTSLFSKISKFNKYVEEEVVDQGMFEKKPSEEFAKIMMFIALGLTTMNFPLALVGILTGKKGAKRTTKGVEKYSEAKSLLNFLKSQDDQINFQSQNQMFFEKLLPYAAAFGVEKIWAERFKDIAMAKPDWYEGNNFTNSIFIGDMTKNIGGSVRSVYSSSMSSTKSSSGFSSGFSGGSSGGGGGGGGGGSW